MFAVRLALALAASTSCAALHAQEPTAYEQGVAARQAGQPGEAARLLTEWLVEHPEDVDARLQLAYANLGLGRLEEAEAGFRAVLSAAPTYADAQTGLELVAQARVATKRNTQLSLEGAVNKLPRVDDWREVQMAVSAPVGTALTLEGRAAWYHRFGREDVEVGAQLNARAGENLWLRAGIGATPKADFRPSVSLTGGADWRIVAGPSATVLTFDVRYEDFPMQGVVTVSPGVVQYLAGGKAWLTVRALGVLPEGQDLRFGVLARADFTPADRLRLFVGVADGPDTELGTVIDVTSVFGGAELPIGERVSLFGSLARETRKGPADRTEFRMGIKTRL